MFLDISQALKTPGEEFHYSVSHLIPPLYIYGETIEFDSINLSGVYYSTGTEVIISGELITKVYGKCGVCLKPFYEGLKIPFTETFVYSSSDNSFKDGVFSYQGSKIEVDELINELIIPQIPMKFICGNDCDKDNLYLNENEFRNKNVNENNPFNVLQSLFKNDEEV